MHIPTIQGVIERRILVNYRVEPEVLARVLPAPFRPKLVNGVGLAGVCLIRLQGIRPRGLPAFLGIGSENAAHRIAVEWDENRTSREGVYIPRRDSTSRLNTLLGGRVFPGVHHHATFTVTEQDDYFRVALESNDGATKLLVAGRVAQELPSSSVFASLQDASDFFERGSLGYSATKDPHCFDGLELRSRQWHVEPLEVEEVQSTFFENPALFPSGTLHFDCALLMRNIDHEWHGRTELRSGHQPV
ncbi:MAG: DUF2071 domain-containing protein [Ardenticatenales bacterium]|nr:DUF2071 domain-containing protein [Ardenticatenales bacterium]